MPENAEHNPRDPVDEIQDNRHGALQVGRLILHVGQPEGAMLSTASDEPPTPSQAGPVMVRPRPVAAPLGRDALIEALVNAIRESKPAFVYAPPGMGKTTMLTHLAYHVPRSLCPDGVIYLRAQGMGWSDLWQTLYDLVCGVNPSVKPLPHEVLEGLRERQVLLLLDDASLPPEDWPRLVASLPGWRFILAAAQPAPFAGGVYTQRMDGLASDDALTLVEHELGHWVSSADKPAVQHACASLGGNPLALLQLVSLASKQQRPLADLIAALSLEHATEALQEQLWASLSEPERRILMTLASADPVPLSAAALGAVTELPQVAPIVEDLLQQYLVERQGSLYRVRRSLAGALRRTMDTTPWLWRVLGYVLNGLEQGATLSRADEDVLASTPALCRAAAEAGWSTEVVRLARAAEGSLALGRRWDAWEAVLNDALSASRTVADRSTEAWALHQLGTRSLCLGDVRQGRAQLERALRLQRAGVIKTSAKENLRYAKANATAMHASQGAGGRDTVSSPNNAPDSVGLREAATPFPWTGVVLFVLVTSSLALGGALSARFLRGAPEPTPNATAAPGAKVAVVQQSVVQATASPAPAAQEPTAVPTATILVATDVAVVSPAPSLTPSPMPAHVLVYDFAASASRARWRNSVQQVLGFPSRVSASVGLVRQYDGLLEDGQSVVGGLETRPNRAKRGFLRGYYSQAATVEPGDQFRAWVGFAHGAEGGDVTFRLSFDKACDGTYDARWALQKAYDGHLTEWIIPLDAIFSATPDATKGCFALQVDAGESSVDDRAVWVEARIERP